MQLIFTSRGLNTLFGTELIYNEIKKDNLMQKSIFVVSYTPYNVDDRIKDACIGMGFQVENIHMSADGVPEELTDYIYVTEGNAFEILSYMREKGFVEYIRKCCGKDAVYIGSSAGAMIAGMDIELAKDFDSNFVGMKDFTGLGLFEGTIIPHYEPDELKRYIKLTEKELISRYPVIYSVGNDSILCVEGKKVFG